MQREDAVDHAIIYWPGVLLELVKIIDGVRFDLVQAKEALLARLVGAGDAEVEWLSLGRQNLAEVELGADNGQWLLCCRSHLTTLCRWQRRNVPPLHYSRLRTYIRACR